MVTVEWGNESLRNTILNHVTLNSLLRYDIIMNDGANTLDDSLRNFLLF